MQERFFCLFPRHILPFWNPRVSSHERWLVPAAGSIADDSTGCHEMQEVYNREHQFANWHCRNFLTVTPTSASLHCAHLHAQNSAHTFGDLRTREWLIQYFEGCLNRRINH